VIHDKEKLRKELNRNTKQNGRPFQENRTSRRQSQNLKMKWKLRKN
jgi:hypothetical protein